MKYSLWTAVKNEHFSERAGKPVSNDAYKPAGSPANFSAAVDAVQKAIYKASPGTKIKLVITVPEADVAPAPHADSLQAEIAALKAQIASLSK